MTDDTTAPRSAAGPDSEPTEWRHTVLGGVPMSQVLHPDTPGKPSPLDGLGRRVVTLVCGARHSRGGGAGWIVGFVSQHPDGSAWLYVWSPTMLLRQSNAGEPLVTVESGRLPKPASTPTVNVWCPEHELDDVAVARLEAAVAKHERTGKPQRVVIHHREDCPI